MPDRRRRGETALRELELHPNNERRGESGHFAGGEAGAVAAGAATATSEIGYTVFT